MLFYAVNLIRAA